VRLIQVDRDRCLRHTQVLCDEQWRRIDYASDTHTPELLDDPTIAVLTDRSIIGRRGASE
jgi:hypothetical protein